MSNKPNIDNIKHHYAGVVLVTKSGNLIGQWRDNKPDIDNPNLIGTFGGSVEKHEEPKTAAWRELTQEETNLNFSIDEFKFLFSDTSWRKLTEEWEVRHFYSVELSDEQLLNIEIYEGQGWAYINGPDDPDLIKLWKPVIKKASKILKL